ncbi:MAG: peptide MFS transporter [Chitinophagaceae bacterium]|nr:peptide MFS transporter [Chitinophagaceae bacterium]
MQTKNREIAGHPAGLYILFFTEMWERFSFYGMKALLIFYLTKYHFFSDTEGNQIVGNYAALVYALPILGGILADRYLGFRKAVIFGAILLVLGHAGMAIEGSQAYYDNAGKVVRDETAVQVFYFSMGLIIMGVGFLKPNISTIVGQLYDKDDPRRDAGFTIFYMGINLGSFIATLLCGWLGETYGWRYGFGAAGIGMLFGLLFFIWGQKYLLGKAEPPNPELLKERSAVGVSKEWLIYILSAGGVFVCWQLVQHHRVVGSILTLTSVGVVLFLIWFIIRKCTRKEKGQMIVLLVLIIFTVVFWALFEQAYTSMNLFADRIIDRKTSFGEIKASQFLSLNALFIILLAPIFAWIWVKTAKRNIEPSTTVKFALGILLAGLGFGALVAGISNADDFGKVSPAWLVLAYLLHTCGELALSPVGLSAVTKLSVPRIVGFMMGVWFLATASSEFIAARLADIASVDTSGGIVTDVKGSLIVYADLFRFLFYIGLVAGGLLLLLSPLLRKLMREEKMNQ